MGTFAIPSNQTIIEFLKKTTEPIAKQFMLAPPSASTINIRRNSTHQTQNVSITIGNSNDAIINTLTRTTPPSSQIQTTTMTTSTIQPNLNPMKCENRMQTSDTGTVKKVYDQSELPPIPCRTFLGKIMTPRSSSVTESQSSSLSSPSAIKTTINNMCKQTIEEVKRRHPNVVKLPQSQQTFQSTRRIVENQYPIDQYSDDDRFSIESSVFEEPKSSDPIIMNASASNRSSSDSNKSHVTIDTGYMSASNDTERIFFGASEDFRSRFSSVDTQSSIDSCTSSDIPTHQSFNLQSQARNLISPLVAKRDEYEEKITAQFNKSFSRMNSASSILSSPVKLTISKVNNNVYTNGRGGITHTIRQQSQSQQQLTNGNVINSGLKIQQNSIGMNRNRPLPPPPPIAPQNSLDSGRILYNGTMLGAFQSGLAKLTLAAATTSEVVMGRRPLKQDNDINHITKLNQRQDSSISSDSFSMTSSPGYNTKNIEAPLLQNASKINRTNYLNNIRGDIRKNNNNVTPIRATVRQDSSLSDESFSQISNPIYNNKLQEQPLLKNAVKIHASKFRFHFFL